MFFRTTFVPQTTLYCLVVFAKKMYELYKTAIQQSLQLYKDVNIPV